MQIESTTNTNYVNTTQQTSQTQESEKTSEQRFDMNKPFDIDSFTYEDYKAINYDDLEKWIKNSNLPNEKEVLGKTNVLSAMTIMTNDDTFNRVLFDKTNESYNKNGESLLKSVFLPLSEPLVVKKYDSSIEKSMNSDLNNWSASLNGGRRTEDYIFNINDMLGKMQNFPEYYSNLNKNEIVLVEDMSKTLQKFDEILIEYTNRKNLQQSTLEAYTKNNKQSPNLG